MIGILIGMAAASAAMYAWVVGASYVYCRLSHHLDLFVYPWMQWLDIAPDWTINGWTKAYVVASAAAATAPFVGLGALLLRLHQQRRLPVYGKSGWATPAQMDKGGISTSRKLP